jgi:adenine/guanine phosphoribosyltransferase-like PRPP-binding protein
MYTERELVRIARRENNSRRNYLVVNPLQGKHIPVSPGKALGVFSELAGLLRKYSGERLLVVGFAETATAVGARIAIELGAGYIQTTREEIPGVEYLFFSEEHSHATQQKLVKSDLHRVLDRTDRIIFAEDEVTTGKTIRNLIAVLEQCCESRLQFAVASLLNGMKEEDERAFQDRDIGLHYLLKISHEGYPETASQAAEDGIYHLEEESGGAYTACFDLEGRVDARRLTEGPGYDGACREFSDKALNLLPLEGHERVLVLGTEEFMYPGLWLGKSLEERGHEVMFHATTRSPIAVSRSGDYPLHERYALSSFYQEDRRTFLYDIGSFDAVIVVTDAREKGTKGERALLSALEKKNAVVCLVRWCGE